MTVTICDPRIHHQVRAHPQSKKWMFPIAFFFDKKTRSTIRAGFLPVYEELLELEAEGVMVNDVRVPIKFIYGNDLSNLWKGTGAVGGAVGTSTFYCPWCPATLLNRACAAPIKCTPCGAAAGRVARKAVRARLAAGPFGRSPAVVAADASDRDMDDWFAARPCCHHDITTSGGVMVELQRNLTELEAKFDSASDGAGAWWRKVRVPTPTKATAVEAFEERGGDATGLGFETLKARLDFMCRDVVRTDNPAECVGEEAILDVNTGVSTGMEDATVIEQLGHHHIAHDAVEDDEEGVPRARRLLIERITDLNKWKALKLELRYPGISPDAMYPDAHRNVADVLNFEMRVSERIIYELFMAPLRAKTDGARQAVERAAAALRTNTNWPFFRTKFKKGSPFELESFGFSRRHAKTLMRELARDEDGNLVRGQLNAMITHVIPELIPDGPDRVRWTTVLQSYDKVVSIMRKIPDLIMGEDGYEAQLAADADLLQHHGDVLTGTLVKLCSDDVLTNYLHTLRAGHFREMMTNHGYLVYLRNDNVEAVNGEMSVLYHKHGHRGGVCDHGAKGQKAGAGREVSHVESMRCTRRERCCGSVVRPTSFCASGSMGRKGD